MLKSFPWILLIYEHSKLMHGFVKEYGCIPSTRSRLVKHVIGVIKESYLSVGVVIIIQEFKQHLRKIWSLAIVL